MNATLVADPILMDTITKAGPEARGRVVVTGSHGGLLPGRYAVNAGMRGVIFNDAGVGKDRAGVAGLDLCDAFDMPAAAVSHASARIGHADEMLREGVVSTVNKTAAGLGISVGDLCCGAAIRMKKGAPQLGAGAAPKESRKIVMEPGFHRKLVFVDSASLVEEGDAGQIVITGSHGGLFGDDPANALRVDAFAVAFNDAGGGRENAGATRLAPLGRRGMAAFVVAADSAHIGSAFSTYEDGVISVVNDIAAALGGASGMRAKAFIDRLAQL